MQTDPMEEWRRLTTLYGEMGDIEIHELADQINDLTPTAQQVLRDELKKRGIAEEEATRSVQSPSRENAVVHWAQGDDTAAGLDGDGSNSDGPRDYTWKVALCRCESVDEAAARCEMLRRAGIDTWVQRPGSRFVIPWVDELGAGDIQINVTADQLDHAKTIVALPVPQDIIDQIKQEDETPQYQLPVCPKCGAADPTLESVEPSNNWLCESCGYTWSDPVGENAENTTRNS